VVDHHVTSEAGLCGVLSGGPGNEQSSRRACGAARKEDEHQDDDIPAS
jgi:hypothetical protein